jgi:hypothetical protein
MVKKNLNVYEIVKKYLKDEGYDGLFTDEGCGCSLEDLMPCEGNDFHECKAGYKIKGDEDAESYIVPEKPKEGFEK